MLEIIICMCSLATSTTSVVLANLRLTVLVLLRRRARCHKWRRQLARSNQSALVAMAVMTVTSLIKQTTDGFLYVKGFATGQRLTGKH